MTATTSVANRCFAALLLLLAMSIGVCAQSGNMATDGSTPAGLKAGAPAGSYQLSGFDNINYFNGNLNFSLPLVRVGGRGNAGVTVPLRIERKWLVIKTISPPYANTPEPNDWQSIDPGYGPGVLIGRIVGKMPQSCTVDGSYESLDRLTFTSGDGTEYELRDVSSLNGWSGETFYGQCQVLLAPNRGKVFVSADGSGVTFISDSDMQDGAQVSQIFPNGYLLLPDGARYRIDLGKVSWIRDRNGNLIRFEYGSYGVSKIIDSLNREVTIAYGDDPVTSYSDHDEITYKGFGVAVRTIKVWFSQMNLVLRAGYSIQTYGQLFPELNGSTSTEFNVRVISALELPDYRTYQFKYNPYGELARVELPTGGAIEYDYLAGMAGAAASGSYGGGGTYIDKQVYRRVSERRVYADKNSSVFEYRAIISRPEAVGGVNLGFVTVEHRSYSDALLSKEEHYYYGSALTPIAHLPYDYSQWMTGKEWKTKSFASAGTESQAAEQTWQQPQYGYSWPLTQAETNTAIRPNNPKTTQTLTTLVDSNQVAKQTFAYDANFNQTDVYEYGYGNGAAGALVRRKHTDYLTSGYDAIVGGLSNPDAGATIHIRNLPTQQIVYDAGGTQRAKTTYEYDVHTGDYHAGLMARTGISGLCNGSAYCPNGPNFTSTTYTTRGNATKVSRWLDTTGLTINTYAQYDVAGNVVKAIDPRSTSPSQPIATTFEFNDRFGSPNGEAQGNDSSYELQQQSQSSFAFPTKVINAMGHVSYTQYDYYLGKPVDVEDPNQIKSSIYYADALDRPTKGITAVGTSVQAQTNIFYDDVTDRVITTARDKDSYGESGNASNPGGIVAKAYYDGLGRTYRTAVYEGYTGSNNTWAITVSQFDALGRVKQTTNPFRATTPNAALPQSPEWTTTLYDLLGRVLTVTTPDTAVVSSVYSGNQVTVTDQANKKRSSLTDALGRLTQVTEDPTSGGLNYQTDYTFDVLDNLRKVQQGSQARFFAYDSLSRLVRARNPEQDVNTHSSMAFTDPVTGNTQWSMAYTFDENGNLKERREARNNPSAEPIKTTYAYDSLNRNTLVEYNDSITPAIARFYDNTDASKKGKGRFWFDTAYYSDGAYLRNIVSEYDSVGRVKSKSQGYLFGSEWRDYTSSVSYDLAGNALSQTYPSGRVVATSYDQAGRVSNLGTNGSTLVNNFSYAVSGGLLKQQFSNGLWEHRRYNNRLQTDRVRVGMDSNPDNANAASHIGLEYTFSDGAGNGTGPNNNGNVRTQTIAPLPSATPYVQAYTYDNVNRLTIVEEKQGTTTTVKQTWGYDLYGNRWSDTTGGNTTSGFSSPMTLQSHFIATTNRIDVSALASYSYDKAGNLTTDMGNRGYGYDGENRLRVYCETGVPGCVGSTPHTTYIYDADGRRVKKISGGETVYYIYGALGQLIAEYGSPPASNTAGTRFVTSDHLGSTRLLVNATSAKVHARYDYVPFGEEVPSSFRPNISGYSTGAIRQKFVGYERDNELGLDYAGARYFASTQGRFTSIDPIFFQKEMLVDPQRYNLYAYVRNNPLRFADPDGEAIELLGDDEKRKRILEGLRESVGKQAGAYLYENKVTDKNGTTRYFVGIYTNGPDGKGKDFRSMNNVSSALGRIITDERVASVSLVDSGYKARSSVGDQVQLVGPIQPSGIASPGATDASSGRMFLLDPKNDYGALPGSLMSNGLDNKIDFATALGHELGHIEFDWGLAVGPSRDAAVGMENMVRKLKDPSGPTRVRHNPNDPKIGQAGFVINCNGCRID